MKTITLIRVADTDAGMFGVLLDEGTPFALTLERRWLKNRVGESCIPDGVYMCERVQSPKFGDTFEVKSVPGRSAILFHKGNLMEDSHGCILVGEQFGALNGAPALLASGPGYQEFMDKLKDEQAFTIEIVSAKEKFLRG